MTSFLDALLGKTRYWRDWCSCSGWVKENRIGCLTRSAAGEGPWSVTLPSACLEVSYSVCSSDLISYTLWKRWRSMLELNIPCLPEPLVSPLALVNPGGLLFNDILHWDNSPSCLETSSLWANCSLWYFFSCTNQQVHKELEQLKNCYLRRKIQSYFILNPEVTNWVNVDTDSVKLVRSKLLLIFRMLFRAILLTCISEWWEM